MTNLLFIFGTRPEAIKLAPLIKVFQQNNSFNVKICVTAQHREMLDQVLNFFSITPDYDLNIMTNEQSLFQITCSVLNELGKVIDYAKPHIVFVQGDTTTVFAGALSAFYKNIKVAHIEAGLRSFNKHSPFPEEMNRVLTSRLSDFHFVPTNNAKDNLNKEGIIENVFVVGNTVIDALVLGLSIIEKNEKPYIDFLKNINFNKRILLVTCHRRESFGKPFENICDALLEIASQFNDIEIIYPVHLNPNIKEVAYKKLNAPNIKLTQPLAYPHLIWLMKKSYIILTDSGGIQEEAPTLGKPVLVLRNVTERIEGIEAGNAKLVGTNKKTIVKETRLLLTNDKYYERMATIDNPYGDGTTSKKIEKKLIELIEK